MSTNVLGKLDDPNLRLQPCLNNFNKSFLFSFFMTVLEKMGLQGNLKIK